MKNWLVATYKINEVERVENNLISQSFNYYLPKIVIKNLIASPKKKPCFLAIFLLTLILIITLQLVSKGIKNIIRFGENIAHISDDEIKSINLVEESSRSQPLVAKIKIGQEVNIKSGSLKGNIAKICSLPSKKESAFYYIFLVLLKGYISLKKILHF